MKKLILSLVLILSFSLVGCNNVGNISSSNYDVVSEYIASLLLKYDKSYEEKLVNPNDSNQVESDNLGGPSEDNSNVIQTSSITDKTSSNTSTEAVSNNSSEAVANTSSDNKKEDGVVKSNATMTEEKTEQYQQLSEVFSNKYIDLQYNNYKLCENFPENTAEDYFTLDASASKQLLVIQFDIKNKTSKNRKLNLLDSGITYQLEINSNTYNPLLTLLVNDLQFIDTQVKGGKSEKGYLVFEVPKNIKIDTANLYVSKESLKSSVSLK